MGNVIHKILSTILDRKMLYTKAIVIQTTKFSNLENGSYFPLMRCSLI